MERALPLAPRANLTDFLAEALERARDALPTAEMLAAHFAPRATAVTRAGPNLQKPSWADTVSNGKDLYLTLGGDILGMYLHEDPRGGGAYATLYVARGSLSEIEEALGGATPVPRNPDDFRSGPSLALEVQRGESRVRLFVELTEIGGTGVRSVMLHFQR